MGGRSNQPAPSIDELRRLAADPSLPTPPAPEHTAPEHTAPDHTAPEHNPSLGRQEG